MKRLVPVKLHKFFTFLFLEPPVAAALECSKVVGYVSLQSEIRRRDDYLLHTINKVVFVFVFHCGRSPANKNIQLDRANDYGKVTHC